MNALDVLSAMVNEGSVEHQEENAVEKTAAAPADKASRAAMLLELLKNKKMALGAGAGMMGLAAMGAKSMKGAKAKKAAEALAKLKAEKASKMRKRVAAGAAIGGGAGLAALLSKKASAKVKVAAAFITKIAAMSPAERKAFAKAMEAFLASGKKIKK